VICRRRQLRGARARTSPGTSPSNSPSTSPTPPGASCAASHAPQAETPVGGPVPRQFFWYLSRLPPWYKCLKCY
jgi:hypothetical protein